MLKLSNHLKLFVLLALSVVAACSGNKNVSDASDPEFAKYILSHTMGVVSRTSEVQLSVAPDVAKAINKHGDINKLFTVSPQINGEIVWDSARTMYFRPKTGLKPDEKYTVEFKLGQVAKVDDSFEAFVFGFKTIKPNLTVRFDGLKQALASNKKNMLGEGQIRTADVMTLNELEKVIEAKQGGRQLKVELEETIDPNIFRYVIQDIERTKGESPELELKWEGAPVDVEVSGKKKVSIPAIDEFKLVDLKVFHEPEQFLMLEFSDALSEKQYLKGLIKIKNLSGLKYVRDGNSLKVIPPRRISGSYELNISNTLENFQKDKLKAAVTRTINFEKMKPAIKFVTNGVILPSSKQGLILPFEAVNLKAVDVVVTKIFENNMLQFLQENELSGKNQLRRVGRPVANKTIRLDDDEIVNANQWNHYYLDLNELIKPDKGAVYRVYLAYRQEHSIYACKSDQEIEKWTDEKLEKYWNTKLTVKFYSQFQTELQALKGICKGILTDGIINEKEIFELDKWLNTHKHLESFYPYDEIRNLITAAMRDGKIDDNEQALLKRYFADFSGIHTQENAFNADNLNDLEGLFSKASVIQFKNKAFSTAKISSSRTIRKIRNAVEKAGAKFNKKLNDNTDYLIIGDDPNDKSVVEKAIKLRKGDHMICLVRESDFWSVIQ